MKKLRQLSYIISLLTYALWTFFGFLTTMAHAQVKYTDVTECISVVEELNYTLFYVFMDEGCTWFPESICETDDNPELCLGQLVSGLDQSVEEIRQRLVSKIAEAKDKKSFDAILLKENIAAQVEPVCSDANGFNKIMCDYFEGVIKFREARRLLKRTESSEDMYGKVPTLHFDVARCLSVARKTGYMFVAYLRSVCMEAPISVCEWRNAPVACLDIANLHIDENYEEIRQKLLAPGPRQQFYALILKEIAAPFSDEKCAANAGLKRSRCVYDQRIQRLSAVTELLEVSGLFEQIDRKR